MQVDGRVINQAALVVCRIMCIYTRRDRTCPCLTVSACHKGSLVFCLGHKVLMCESVKVPRLCSAAFTPRLGSNSYGATAIHSLCLLPFSFIRGVVPALQRVFAVVTITNFPDAYFAMAAAKRVAIRAPSQSARSPRRKPR